MSTNWYVAPFLLMTADKTTTDLRSRNNIKIKEPTAFNANQKRSQYFIDVYPQNSKNIKIFWSTG